MPCYFLGAAAYMSTAYMSDRMQRRGLFCVIFGAISVVGYAILLADVSSGVHYFGCFLVAGGLYVVVGLPLAWVSLIRICLRVGMMADLCYSCRQTRPVTESGPRARVCN